MPRRRLFNSFWGNLLNNGGGGNVFDYGQGPNMGIGPPPGGLMDNMPPPPRGVMGQPGFIGNPLVPQGGAQINTAPSGPPAPMVTPPPAPMPVNTAPVAPSPMAGSAPAVPANNFDPNSIEPFTPPPPPSVGYTGPDATMGPGQGLAGQGAAPAIPGQAAPLDDQSYRNQIMQRRAGQNVG